MKTYTGVIQSVTDGQCFVFGSNAKGFHGAGAAGFAMLGVSGNKWRTAKVPNTNETLDKVPPGTPGFYAVSGIVYGFQRGLYGCSYAICTVLAPGAKRSIALSDIKEQIRTLYRFAANNRHMEFYVAGGVGTPLNGYTLDEMAEAYCCDIIPSNMIFNDAFYKAHMNTRKDIVEERCLIATGHRQLYIRDEKTYINNVNDPDYRELVMKISRFIEFSHSKQGMNTFVSGMALGFDLAFAHAVLLYKQMYGVNIRLVAMIPFRSQPDVWRPSSQIYYKDILSQADEVNILYPNPKDKREAATSLNNRNIAMLQRASAVLAYYDGGQSGGTYNCIRGAKSYHLPVVVMDPISHKFNRV